MKGMRVDKDTKLFLERLAHVIRSETSFRPGDMLLALYDMPGLVYLMEGKSPVVPWVSSDTVDYRCVFATDWARSVLKPSVYAPLVLVNVPIRDNVAQCLNKVGRPFPGSYSRLVSLRWPYHMVWDRPTVDIYVPSVPRIGYQETAD